MRKLRKKVVKVCIKDAAFYEIKKVIEPVVKSKEKLAASIVFSDADLIGFSTF